MDLRKMIRGVLVAAAAIAAAMVISVVATPDTSVAAAERPAGEFETKAECEAFGKAGADNGVWTSWRCRADGSGTVELLITR